MHLDDVAVVETDRVEQPPDVVEHLARLGLDAAGHGAVAAGRVADLAGEEDEAVGLDDLARTGGARLDPGCAGTVLGMVVSCGGFER